MGCGWLSRTIPGQAVILGWAWLWDNVIAPPPGRWNEPPEWLHELVDTAASAYMAWRRMVAEAEAKSAGRSASPRRLAAIEPHHVTATAAPDSSSGQSLRARRALACYEHITRSWDPEWVAPKGGHKRGRSRMPRQHNRLGPSMRQLASQWGITTLGSGTAGIEILDDLCHCGAITRQPDGAYRVDASADAVARIRSLK